MEKEIDISILKRRFFPSFYQNEAPRLIEFIRYYLEWMQMEGNPYWTINNLKDFTSIDGSIDTYLEHLQNELMLDFPIEYAGDLRYIMKHLVMLYQSKGTLASYEFFFRAVYNSFCRIWYPREYILKASDGKWIQGYFCYLEGIDRDTITDLISLTVTEVETGLTGLISNVEPHYFVGDNELRYCLVITDNLKQFSQGNHLRIEGIEGEFQITKAEYSNGYWDGTDGFLDSDKLLQDGYYYQNFSYEITSLVPFDEYKDIVEKLIHPAGMKLFGRYQVVDEVNPIGCPEGSGINQSFIRWWIITIFVYVLAQEKKLCGHSWKIWWTPRTFQNPYTADVQYWHKQYSRVNTVKYMTPNQLYTYTNDSNKLVFIDGDCVTVDWANYRLPYETKHYDIVGLYANHPLIEAECTNGTITIPSDKEVSDYVWIFVNGKKIREAQITRTSAGFTIAGNPNGPALIYNLRSDIFKRKQLSLSINNNRLTIKGSTREQLLVFIDGEFVWDNCDYDTVTGVLTLPKSTGILELYEVISNQNLHVRHYYVEDNSINYLYVELPLLNISVNSDDPILSEMINFLKPRTFLNSYVPDEQLYNKTYGTIEQIGDWKVSDVMANSNESCKMYFYNGLLRNVDWAKHVITDEKSTGVDYEISGIRAVYPHFQKECSHGFIQTVPNYASPSKLTNAKVFIFVDGLKVPDAQVSYTDYGYTVPSTYNGIADLYFLDPDVIEDSWVINTAASTITIGTGLSRQRLLCFANGRFSFDNMVYHNEGTLDLPASSTYVELYLLKEHFDYRTFAYKSDRKYEYWSNPSKTLYCYNPVTNIIPSV